MSGVGFLIKLVRSLVLPLTRVTAEEHILKHERNIGRVHTPDNVYRTICIADEILEILTTKRARVCFYERP